MFILSVYLNYDIIYRLFVLCLNLMGFALNNITLKIILMLSIIIIIYISYIDKNFKNKYPNLYKILLCICTTIIIIIIAYYTISILSNILQSYVLKVGGETNPSGNKGTSGTSNTTGSGGPGGSGKPGGSSGYGNLPNNEEKRKKPKLTIITKKEETPLEVDTKRIAECEHTKRGSFQAGNMKDVEDTYCDMVDASNTQHKAFEGRYDNAVICKNCFCIICKNCVQDYSSDEEE